MKYYMLLDEDDCIDYNYECELGLNEWVGENRYNPGFCCSHRDIFATHDGVRLAVLTFSEDEKMFESESMGTTTYHSKRIYIEDILDIDVKVMSDLIDCGINREYALHWACKHGKLGIVDYITKNGFYINNDSAIRYASENGHLDIVKLLLSRGWDSTGNKLTGIRIAAWYNHTEIVEYLVPITDNVPYHNKLKKIAIHVDRNEESVEQCCKKLLKCGYLYDDDCGLDTLIYADWIVSYGGRLTESYNMDDTDGVTILTLPELLKMKKSDFVFC